MENIKALLKSENEETLEALRKDPLVIWIDWHEYDEDIVKACENVLKTGALKSERRKADDEKGFEVVIIYKGDEIIISNQTEASRDTAIIALNSILQPEYEIRFCDWSFGNDTLAIIPMLSSSWVLLEEEFGEEAVRNQFSIIDENKKMFSLRGKALKAMLKKRGFV